MATKEEAVAVPPVVGASAAATKQHPPSMADHSDYTVDSTGTSPDHDVIAAHRSLHRFMVTLLHDAAVTGLKTILIQDNASILSKSASRSARAAHQRLALGGRDHMIITKEISRWESYPYEVDKPLVVNKPKRAKNGCVPQRRAKRRSGLESAGEIKADIIKKAESLPRRPRRRSSVVTDDAQKNTMQQELLSLFLYDDDSTVDSETENNSTTSDANNNNSTKSDKSASRPKREVSPLRRIMIPKKPIRRLSEIPDNNNSNNSNNGHSASNQTSNSLNNNQLPTKNTMLSDFMADSQHSTTSTETTLSEIGTRQSDLSSVGEQTTDFLSALEENRLLDCSAILEEEEEQLLSPLSPNVQPGAPTNVDGNKRQIQSPRKPMRRTSESVEATTAFGFDRSGLVPAQGETMEPLVQSTTNAVLTDDEALPTLSSVESNSIDHDESLSVPLENINKVGIDDPYTNNPDSLSKSDNPTPPRRGITDERIVERSASMPRKPTRRVSEVPQDLLSAAVSKGDNHIEAPENAEITCHSGGSDCRQNEAQHSYSTESTASETTSDGSTTADEVTGGVFLQQQQQPIIQATETTQPLDCAVIPEEENDGDDPELRDCQE